VQILRFREHQVLISKGLNPNDIVVTSQLATPMPGMNLEPIFNQPSEPSNPTTINNPPLAEAHKAQEIN